MRTKPGTCSVCGPVEKYYAKGLCLSCYGKKARKDHPERYRSQDRKKRLNNLEYYRAYDRERSKTEARKQASRDQYSKHKEKRRVYDKNRYQAPSRQA